VIGIKLIYLAYSLLAQNSNHICIKKSTSYLHKISYYFRYGTAKNSTFCFSWNRNFWP